MSVDNYTIVHGDNFIRVKRELTRNVISISERKLTSGTIYSNTSDDGYFYIKKGTSFMTSVNISRPQNLGVFIEYMETNGIPTGYTGGKNKRSKSFKFTKATKVKGYMKLSAGDVHITSGSIHWIDGKQ